MARQIRKIVVLGANGAMGSGAAARCSPPPGIPTTFLARTLDKAEAGRARAEQLAKGDGAGASSSAAPTTSDLAHALAEADLVFEAVAEDLAIKRDVLRADRSAARRRRDRRDGVVGAVDRGDVRRAQRRASGATSSASTCSTRRP